jgi:tRNA U34 5-methylaminomethyl-2-thiouridine-forming methyltransferase MnmC
MRASEIDRALSRWPEIEAERLALCTQWPDHRQGRIDIDFAGGMHLTVICGTAFEGVCDFSEEFDAWYLDGFAPKRNPDMWSQELMRLAYEKTVGGGTFATYAAAGFVRRNLQAAGFTVERRPGFGSKREMLGGVKSTSGVA